MALPTVFKYGVGIMHLGDGAASEVFTTICGFTSMSLEIKKDTNDISVADCNNPDAAVWATSIVTSQGWSMSFEGHCAKEALPLVEAATFSSASRGVRLRLVGAGTGGATPDKQYSGKAHVTMTLGGKKGDLWTINVDVTGDGALAVASVAALP